MGLSRSKVIKFESARSIMPIATIMIYVVLNKFGEPLKQTSSKVLELNPQQYYNVV